MADLSQYSDDELNAMLSEPSGTDLSKYSGAQLEKMLRDTSPAPKFGGGPQSTAEDNPANGWKGTVSNLAHATLPTLGLVGGGILGGAAATPETLGLGTIPGAAVGGGLGYAAGGRVAKGIDAALGIGAPETTGDALTNTAKDTAIGTAYGLIGPGLGAGGSLLKQIGRNALVGGLGNAAGGIVQGAVDNSPTSLWDTAKNAALGAGMGAGGTIAGAGYSAGAEASGAAKRAFTQGNGIGGAVKSAIGSAVPEGLPGKILQKAARIPESNLSPNARAERYQTLADNGGTFDQAGYDNYNKALSNIHSKVDAALTPYKGKVVGSNDIVNALESLKADAPFQSNPDRFLKVIDDRISLYKSAKDASAPFENLTVGQAQKLKVQRNKDLSPTFSKQDKSFVNPLPTEEMQVLDAERGALKNLIEQSTGDANIKSLNAQEGKMLGAGQLLTKAVSKAENSGWNMIHPLRSVINPATRSKVAIGMQNARNAYTKGLAAERPASSPGYYPALVPAGNIWLQNTANPQARELVNAKKDDTLPNVWNPVKIANSRNK